ncbi:DUF1538 domain-containing protein [Roseicella aerolata]|uniref:DUF1538 domain-containing protein n=1 Tax=Roseicella aerolata TaxID=2883479 RepID=A0A9X1LDM6_9PROT|nr:DUF1538 domain-containing protein [Roseicella aerolata]MCB4825338.1 DUF1538 domain-containing protein [Roseicella aerolata]
MDRLPGLIRVLLENLRDLAPLLLVVGFFYAVVLRAPPPEIGTKLAGAVLVVLGLTFFVRGLSMSLFPLGEGLADTFARRGNLILLLSFAFAIGFGSTVAEPALLAVAMQAGTAAAEAGLVEGGEEAATRTALALRYAASAAVGVAVVLGCLRIILGWPAWWFLLGGYGLAATLALLRDTPLLGVAFDAGAAATSAINIPLIAALGIGLASVIHGRRPLADGFGVVALASLMPMLVVLLGALVMG